jgi:predicted transcriptional regulator
MKSLKKLLIKKLVKENKQKKKQGGLKFDQKKLNKDEI